MAMKYRGLVKLAEECGELIQACAKKIAYPDDDIHPDGSDMLTRLEDEIADVRAALLYVQDKMLMDTDRIHDRAMKKLTLFKKWESEQ